MLKFSLGLELTRLCALYRYGVLDTPPEAAFDVIPQRLCDGLGVPSAQIVFVDDQRLWTKAAEGTMANEVAKDGSLSVVAIERGEPTVIEDNASGEPELAGRLRPRAYLGVPLVTPDQHRIGVVFAADHAPRRFSQADIDEVRRAAQHTMALLDAKRSEETDGSSGALGAAAFAEMVSRIAALALQHRGDTSVLAIDVGAFRAQLDGLKADLGRLVVERIGALGRIDLRRIDSFGRLGEDLFAVLLPETDAEGTRILAARLTAALTEGWSVPSIRKNEMVLAVGQASLRPGPCRPEDLLGLAVADCRRAAAARPQPRVGPRLGFRVA